MKKSTLFFLIGLSVISNLWSMKGQRRGMVLQDEISALIAAIIDNNFDEVKKIVENKPAIVNFVIPLNRTTFGGDTPLHIALKYADIKNKPLRGGFKKFLSSQGKGADVKKTKTVRDNKIAEFLIDHGADINAQDSFGATPLNYTVSDDNEEAVKLLLDKGANPNIVDKFQGTPLSSAVSEGNREIVKLLLEHGANPDLQLQNKEQKDMIALLQSAGVDVDDADDNLLSRVKDPEIRAMLQRSGNNAGLNDLARALASLS